MRTIHGCPESVGKKIAHDLDGHPIEIWKESGASWVIGAKGGRDDASVPDITYCPHCGVNLIGNAGKS